MRSVTPLCLLQALPSALYVLRATLFAAVTAVSLSTQHVLGSVESVVGSVCVIASSLLLPTVFYAALRLQRGLMRPWHWTAAAAVAAVGGTLMGVVLFQTAEKVVAWLGGGGGARADVAWLEGEPEDAGVASVVGPGLSGLLEW